MKTFVNIASLALLLLLSCSRNSNKIESPELLEKYALKMLKTDGLSYDVVYNKKDLFSNDTTISRAHVSFLKTGNSINYLRIVENISNNELLFVNDSAWSINPRDKSMTYLGGKESIKLHGLNIFLPAGVLFIDTAIFRKEPFWSYSDTRNGFVSVSFALTNKPDDISNMDFNIKLDTSRLTINEITESATFGKTGTQFQKKQISNYNEISSKDAISPGHYQGFKRVFQKVLLSVNKGASERIFLKELKFWNLDGDEFTLPENSLVFLDIWYVGCHPCMKAAPMVEQIYHEYKDRIQFYSVNEMDVDISKINRFKEKMGITFPIILGTKKYISQKAGNGGYPLFLLLDTKNGEVLWSYSGYSIDLRLQIKKGIDPFIKQ